MECLELSGEWLINDVRAAFSRRYLHQSKALELFFHNRSKWACGCVSGCVWGFRYSFEVFSSHPLQRLCSLCLRAVKMSKQFSGSYLKWALAVSMASLRQGVSHPPVLCV